jgi:hypothetical protein
LPEGGGGLERSRKLEDRRGKNFIRHLKADGEKCNCRLFIASSTLLGVFFLDSVYYKKLLAVSVQGDISELDHRCLISLLSLE